MPTFLLKTEPSEYSFADLAREKRCVWSGVANPQALATLRTVAKGDEVLFYHTGDVRAIVGLARVVRGAYPDPDRPEKTNEGLPKFAVVDLAPVRAASSEVTLAMIKQIATRGETPALTPDFPLLKQSRLSVILVPEKTATLLRKLAGLEAAAADALAAPRVSQGT
jgi:predicted RNA-binding protein with PUA-like domain